MRLIYEHNGRDVLPGDTVQTGKGEWYEVVQGEKPRHASSEGYVLVKDPIGTRRFYASVIGAKWIEREDRVIA
jgi:hypothetical protein